MKQFSRVSEWLRRLNPRLRLRYDTALSCWAVDQFDLTSGWSTLFKVKGNPSIELIHRLRYLDIRQFTTHGKLTPSGMERWFARHQKARTAKEEKDHAALTDWIDQEMRPRFAYAYGKSGWKNGMRYRLQDVKDFAASRGHKI